MAIDRLVWQSGCDGDPWDKEVEDAVQNPDAIELCYRCLTPQEGDGWFCPHCHAATGPYNNSMPYVNLFSQGDVLRIGTTEQVRPTFLIAAGYILYSLSCYFIFAPVYWYYLFKNLKRQREGSPSSS